MKQITKRIFIFLLITGIYSAITFAQENQSYFIHTVEKGQGLYSIAAMYKISQEDIIKANPGSQDKIYIGQALRIPQLGSQTEKQETFHTIKQGETLYKLTAIYQLSAKEICDANPGLSAENFRIGQVIRIPSATLPDNNDTKETIVSTIPGTVKSRCKDMHKVQRKETLFSVSREYGITEQELMAANPELKNGMKRGQLLCIPYSTSEPSTNNKGNINTTPISDKDLFKASEEAPKQYHTVKAAVLLPFTHDKRMVEYYEGFLIAVDSLKRAGFSYDIYAYNLTDQEASLNAILAKEELKTMNIIIGPAQSKYSKKLADFAKINNIWLVIPFSSKEDEVFNNPHIFQINTPQSYLYSEVYDHFDKQFTNPNIIFLDAGTNATKNKMDFIDGLKQNLSQKNIPYQALPETASVEGLIKAMNSEKENIFIPTSSSDISLIKIIPQLTILSKENPELNMHLFGYPEWQTYTKDYIDNFFELDTYFYSSFYTNNLLPAAIDFTKTYHKWYSKDMDNSYPKYGMLGFDTGFFFLKGLSQYGTDFENKLDQMDIRPIQTGFNFQRVNNWGGFINKKAFFVHFTKDFELIKLDFE